MRFSRANRRIGISIGHRDTDSLIRSNQITGNWERGVLFRRECGRDYAPHRNVLEANRIVDNGPEDGIAIEVEGKTEQVTIRGNEITETHGRGRRTGVCLGPETLDIHVADNDIEGFTVAVADDRK